MHVLPIKFESILRLSDLSFQPLILKVEDDLSRFRKLVRYSQAQGAGCLAVIDGLPGRGKTTSAYAATVLMHDRFEPVLAAPSSMSVSLRELPSWLKDNIPESSGDRTTLVLIDGREATDDSQGLKDALAAMNNLVRGRPDLLFVWPTTDPEWRETLVNTARKFGSQSFCPDDAVFSVSGPGRGQWVEAVSLVMNQLNVGWDEFGVNEATASAMTADYDTLGSFLTAINQVRVDQEELAEGLSGLPEVIFVVSSHSGVVGDVARLRSAKNYRLRTDEVIASARSSEPGKFWVSRGSAQKSNLAWVSSLFQAKLLSLTPSTVANACYTEAPEESSVRKVLGPLEFVGNRGRGRTALGTTDLGRFLNGDPVPEILNKNKGKTSPATIEAYDKIQALSKTNHKVINESILRFVGASTSLFNPDEVQYEVGLGGDAIVDAIVPSGDRRYHMEFHHLSSANCSPNKIATYLMRKLRVYATQYNLIER